MSRFNTCANCKYRETDQSREGSVCFRCLDDLLKYKKITKWEPREDQKNKGGQANVKQ